MGKIINFIKKYRYQILLIFIYLLFFIQMQNVVMYADDYFVKSVFREYDSLISQIYWIYYKGFSGRLIGQFIVHGGLGYFGLQFFKILNPVFLFMFCFYISKLINIKNNHNTLQITLFLSIIILGLDSCIVSECLYWADGTILYLWSYMPLLLILYFILDCCINNRKLSNFRFVLSIIFIIIISFTMESTAAVGIIFLFLIYLDNSINKNNINNKKILLLLLFSVILLIGIYFIPGNQSRVLWVDSSFYEANIFEKIQMRLPNYLGELFSLSLFKFLFIISGIFIYRIFKFSYNKLCKIFGVFLIIFNMFIFVNCQIYNFIDFYKFNDLTSILKCLCLLYLLINVYIGFVVSREKNKYYFYIVIAGILANLLPVFFDDYIAVRYFLSIIVAFLIYIFKNYCDSDINLKLYILILYISTLNWKLGLIVLAIYLILNIKQKNIANYSKYILVIMLIIFNSINFFKCMYYYYENTKVFDYNERILSEFDRNSTTVIHLKRFTYPNYAFQMPYEHDYIKQWYNDYYNIRNIDIIWDD